MLSQNIVRLQALRQVASSGHRAKPLPCGCLHKLCPHARSSVSLDGNVSLFDRSIWSKMRRDREENLPCISGVFWLWSRGGGKIEKPCVGQETNFPITSYCIRNPLFLMHSRRSSEEHDRIFYQIVLKFWRTSGPLTTRTLTTSFSQLHQFSQLYQVD